MQRIDERRWNRRTRRGRFASRCAGAIWATVAACLLQSAPCAAQSSPAAAVQHLRIVGGLAGVNQYTRYEEPFWTRELARLSGGRANAEIVPFDRAGIRGQEMLRLIQLGVVPFGTAILNLSAIDDAELGTPDLAGLNPDMAALRRSVAAFRPYLKKVLRERYGSELLALYAYPAQVTFCAKPLGNLADLSGRRIRISSATQSDWVVALGATPVQTAFADVVASLRSGSIDCAITGAMSGNAIGLHEVTSQLQTTPVNWGVAAFVANGAAWSALPTDLQELLQRELPKLEQAIWADAEAETRAGIACDTGAASCLGGRKGRMVEVSPSVADTARAREIFVKQVLPGWLKRCGPSCAPIWKQTMAPAIGIELH
jgi:TRAP-type C4-dicarboxylate transport system substrate-binding protein